MQFDLIKQRWKCCDSVQCLDRPKYFTAIDDLVNNSQNKNITRQPRALVVPSFSLSADSGPKFDTKAQFSSNYLEIFVYISLVVRSRDGNYKNVFASTNINVCSDIFSESTITLLTDYSDCEWDFGQQTIRVSLSSRSTISLSDSLIIKSHTLSFIMNNNFSSNENVLTIDNIKHTNSRSIIPVISLDNFRNVIGFCDDLILDARNSYNFGMLC